jgi:DinB superfamily
MLFMDGSRSTSERTHCSECGFDWNSEPDDIFATLGGSVPSLREALRQPVDAQGDREFDRQIRARLSPEVWSIVEYLAHLRDAFSFYRDRIELVLTIDRPGLATRDFAELAEASNYRDENPAPVLATIESTITATATRLRSLQRDQWNRIGIGSSGEERTVLALARRMAHEIQHHLLDIDRLRKQAPENPNLKALHEEANH